MTSPDVRVRARSVRQESGCPVWAGCITTNGYGQISFAGKRLGTHRVTWEVVNGPVPEGLELDHLCRNRACVEPSHLEAVTHTENVRRAAVFRTHCPSGHEFSDSNTRWVDRKGTRCRVCRQCSRAYRRDYRARVKARQRPATHPGAETEKVNNA